MDILNGIKVIDLTMWAFVPSAGGVLAHWGADVIKIEPPHGPDPMRTLAGGDPQAAAAAHPMFRHYNRGKRAMTLDLTTEAGRNVLYKLVEDADVFLTSYLPATRKKLGFDIDDIRARNPRIIYARGTGQGPQGPDAERGGFDGATFWGRGGLADATAHSAQVSWPPGMVGHGDGLSGLTLGSAICIALLQRERTGKASLVDLSLMGMAVWYLGPYINTAREPGGGLAPITPREQRPPHGNTYRTKDNHYFIVSLRGGEDLWPDFCNHLGHPELGTDPRFVTAADRARNSAAGVAILDEIFAQRTFAEWKQALATTKCVWAPIHSVRDIHDDPQTIANRFVREVTYPTGQTFDLVVPPMLFDEDGGQPGLAPDFGQHTEEVLRQHGFSDQEIVALRGQHVIG